MSKTLLRHTLIKHIFDIFVDFLIFIHFHYMKIHRLLLSLQMDDDTPSAGPNWSSWLKNGSVHLSSISKRLIKGVFLTTYEMGVLMKYRRSVLGSLPTPTFCL